MLSPNVPENLFHQAIVQSGSIFASWAYTNDPVNDARDIAAAAGLNRNQSIYSLNRAFMNMNVFDLLSAVDRYSVRYHQKCSFSVFFFCLFVIRFDFNFRPSAP